MGKPTGFLQFDREVAADRPADERIRDWDEFHAGLDETSLRQQGARCMDCGTPFCHLGQALPPGGPAAGCPLGNYIPEWNDLVYRGLWREALERLHQTSNFPEFTGRVCPAPCEGSCVLGAQAPAVTIKSIECAIVDRGFAEGWIVPEPPPRRTGRNVAVVGSGPAGLACAAQLNRAGHRVTVYERADRPGGLLMYGIPSMKLEKRLVQRRVDLLAAEGVRFATHTEVGVQVTADQLRAQYDAVVLCVGATRPRDLAVPGRDLAGIHQAIEFLHGNTRHLLDGAVGSPPVSAHGRQVVILGGGDTGTDCVATAIRHGCSSVAQFDIIPAPLAQRAADNPWPQWPRVARTDYGQEEAIAVFGADPRQYLLSTVRFSGDAAGRVSQVHTVRVEWGPGPDGRPFREVPGSEQAFSADLVLLSMGWLGPESPLLEQFGVARDRRSNVEAEFGRFATNVPGVFAAGDARRGASLVVWALAEGRGAAREVDHYLMGNTDLP